MSINLTYENKNLDLNPLQNFISKVFDEGDQISASSTWRCKGKLNELFYYKNSVTRKGLLVDKDGNPYELRDKPNKINFQEAFDRNFERYPQILKVRKSLLWFHKYELRESVFGSAKTVLKESGQIANRVLTKKFDHLKWELDDFQKLELDRFVKCPLDAISERDMKTVSKIIGIPEKNLISIHNTYSPKESEEVLSEIDHSSPTMEKGLTVSGLGLDVHNSNHPLRFNKSLNTIKPYKTASQETSERRMRIHQIDPNQKALMEYPRMDEFLMMYLEVDFKPNEIDVTSTKKIIMSINNEESGGSFFKEIGNSLEAFNEIYGTGYILSGSFIKEGEKKVIIGVDWKLKSDDRGQSLEELVSFHGKETGLHVFEIQQEKIKRKKSVLDALENNHYNRTDQKGHWDLDKDKMMKAFHAGELGFADPF